VRHVIANAADAPKFDGLDPTVTRIAVGEAVPGWLDYETLKDGEAAFVPDGVTQASDPMLLYFTSGTTAKPKLVLHSHQSYPVGHLTTMYWLGLKPGDVHLNISSPGWAKHAYSCLFAPWNAGAAVFIANQPRFAARAMLDAIRDNGVTTICAPPTVWRMFVQEDLKSWKTSLREVCGAGEPLNPEVIEQVKAAWGLTVRDGFGQTETTLLVGNPPSALLKPGSMGRQMPGYRIVLLDTEDQEAEEGEICVSLEPRPSGLMQGYQNDDGTTRPLTGPVYRTGDVGSRDAEGYITYVGRADDVFKASDYRISPFELESVLIEHAAVAEAAVVPAPDPVRLAVPKAYVILAAGIEPDRATALSIFRHLRERLAPFKRVRRIEFSDLPKTISGKIRRVELRRTEQTLAAEHRRAENEFREEDFPELAR
jgi:acetyl-CoA synthetase